VPEGSIFLADQAYDSNAIRERVEARLRQHPRQVQPQGELRLQRILLSLPQADRMVLWKSASKPGGLATRYDKRADNFLAAIKLLSTRLWINANESTACL
jgi:transposase